MHCGAGGFVPEGAAGGDAVSGARGEYWRRGGGQCSSTLPGKSKGG